MRAGRRIAAAACATFTLVASQATAVTFTAQRSVSPTGSGTACTTVAPCDLQTGVSGASDGNIVVLRAGNYTLSSPLVVNAPNVWIAGLPRTAGEPTITTTGAFIVAGPSATGLTLQQLQVVADATSAPTVSAVSATLMAVDLTSTGGANPVVDVRDLTMRSSAVRTADASGVGVRTANATIVGSTIVANGGLGGHGVVFAPGSFNGVTGAVARIGNSIVVGGTQAIAMSPGTGQTVDLSVDYSSYSGILGAGTASTPTHIGTHNVGPASLVDLPGRADLHQLTGSVTRDAGNPADASNEYDFEGDVRTLGSAPDIGADEYTAPPVVTMLQPDHVTLQFARLRAKLVPALGGWTQYRFEYGPTTAYGFSTPTYTAGSTAAIVGATIGPIPIAVVVHYRLIVTTSKLGSIASSDRTLHMPQFPPDLKHFSVPKPWTHSGEPFNMHFRIDRRARIVVVLTRVRDGHMVGPTCKLAATTGPPCQVRTRRAVMRFIASPAPLIVRQFGPSPGGHRLRPGQYELRAYAQDLATGLHYAADTESHEIVP